MDVQNSTIYEGSFLSSKIPKLAFKLLLVVLLLGWSSQTVYAQCEDAHCLPDAAGNGPDASDAKLYCSNSASVLNGIINCTTAADTDGCGVDASVPNGVDFTDQTLFVVENVPQQCYAPGGTPYNYIQWINFATPEGINSVKLQGVGKVDAWAVFWAGSINTTGKTDIQITDEIRNFSTASLKYVEDACSAQNQYKTWINEDAVISNTDINVYFIALLYDVVSNGSINFKTKECEFIQTCQPEVVCPNEDITFCEGTGDLVDIQAWLDQFSNTDCGNQVTWVLTGEGLNQNFDGNAATIAALAPGTYTLTNTLTDPDTQAVIASCSSDIIVYSQPTAGTGEDDSYCETDDVTNVDLFALLTDEDAGGQWTDANGNVSSPIDLSGYALDTTHTFTYTVDANGDCQGDDESVDIIIYSQPTAGTGEDDSYCETDDVTNVDLFALLTDEDAGGQWTDANGNVSSPIDLSGYALDTTHTFTYTVDANGDCQGDDESVDIIIYSQPTAGTGEDDSYCETDDVTNVDLFALLTDEDAGGQWTDANGNVSSPIDLSGYALDTTHTFTYTVDANGDCQGDDESVDIIIYSQPTAGTGEDDSYCETDDVTNVDLFALLTDEDAGGQWTDANGNVSSPIDLSGYALDTTHTFTYTVDANGDCQGDDESVDIIIYSQPTAGTGEDDSYCETDDVTNVDLFALLTDEDAGGQWTDANGNVSSPIDLSGYALDTTHTFTYTVDANGDCQGDDESVDIIIYSQPTAGTGEDDSYCETDDVTNVDLFALLTDEDAGGQWTDANGNVSSPIDLSGYALDTTHTFTYTVDANGDCQGDDESVDIIIYSQPTAGTGEDDSYCETDDVTNVDLFALLTDEDAGGQWTDANGNVSSPIDLSGYALDTTHTFTYTVDANGDCQGDDESVDIIIYSQPTAGTGEDDSYCETDDVTNVDLFALLTDEDAGGQWTDANGNVSSPIDLSGYALDTTHTFTYTVDANGDCQGDDESVDIIIYSQPTAGTGEDDSYCETDDVTNVDLFALLTDEDAGGQWTDANGNVSSPIDLSGYALDTTHTFTYTVDANGDCQGDDESVDIIIYSQPTAGTGEDDSYCETDDVTNVDLFALLTDEDAGGQWTDANGNVSSPIDLSGYALDTTHTFTYTVDANGDCQGDDESVDIIIYSQPTAGTGEDDSYCETDDVTNVDLFALLTDEDAGGQWTDANGNVSSPIDLSGYALDTTHTFTYTVDANGDCQGDDESVDIIIYSQPTAGTGEDDSYCETDDVTNVDLFALLTDEDAGGQWTDANGNVSSPIDLSGYALDTTHTFTYTVDANGDCQGDDESVDIIIYSQPTAGTGEDDSYCETDDVTNVDLFALLTDEDAGGQWTDANGNVSSPIDLSGYALDTTHTFTYTVDANGDCQGDDESVDIIIYSQPTAGTGEDDSYCETDDVTNVDLFALLTDEDAGGQWTDANGNVSSPIDLSGYALDTTHTFTYTVDANGDCQGDDESVDIIIYSQPTAGTGEDDSYCETDDVTNVDLFALLTDEDAGGQWTDANGNVSSPIDLSGYALDTTHTFTYTVDANGDCQGDDESVDIIIYSQPTAGTGEDDSYCEGDSDLTSVNLDALLSGADGGGQWSDSNGNVSSPIDLSSLEPNDYVFTYTVDANGDCEGDNESVTITINPLPTVDVQIGDTTLCVVAGDVTTVTAAPLPPGSYDYVWTVPAGWTDPNEIIVGDNPGNVASFDTGLIGVYSVTITNTETGCTAMSSGTINPVFEEVIPITFTNEYCADDAPETLFVEGPEGVDLVWYKLIDGDKILVPDEELGDNGYPLAPSIPGEYLFIVEQAIGDCQTSSDALSTITVNPNPDCDISGPVDVCEDILQTYTYNGAAGDLSYEWGVSGDGAIDGGNTGSSVDIIPNGVGSYSVTLMVTDNVTGCTSMCNYEVTTYDCCDSETAFGYDNGGNAGTSNICFLSDEAADLGLNTNRWGWTIEGLDLETDISADEGNQYNSYTFELYAGNGNSCDPNEGPGTLVGDVTVTRVGDNLVATYDVSDAPEGFDYKLYTGHFNASCMPFPKKKKNRINSGGPRYSNAIGFTVAPGQYTASGEGNGGDTVVIEIPVSEMDGCLDNFYVIAHAEVDICTLTPTTDQVAGIDKVVDEPAVEDTIDLSGDFNMYPIPFKNEINVQYNFNYDTDVNITVYDIKGVVVYNKSFNGYIADTKGSATIDMSRQSNQMFFVRVSTNRDVLTKTAISEGK